VPRRDQLVGTVDDVFIRHHSLLSRHSITATATMPSSMPQMNPSHAGTAAMYRSVMLSIGWLLRCRAGKVVPDRPSSVIQFVCRLGDHGPLLRRHPMPLDLGDKASDKALVVPLVAVLRMR
jgi:hypothetical protein